MTPASLRRPRGRGWRLEAVDHISGGPRSSRAVRADAWDVDRLVQLAQSLPIESVAVSSIHEVDTTYLFDTFQATNRAVTSLPGNVDEIDPVIPILIDPAVRDGRDAPAGSAGRRVGSPSRIPPGSGRDG